MECYQKHALVFLQGTWHNNQISDLHLLVVLVLLPHSGRENKTWSYFKYHWGYAIIHAHLSFYYQGCESICEKKS